MESDIKISVVIPNYNHGTRLVRTINALKDQVLPNGSIEIIVIDNFSIDDSKRLSQHLNVSYLEVEFPKNPYACRNIGLKFASGEYIALLDSTCIPADNNYLYNLLKVIDDRGIGLSVGNIRFEMSEHPSISEITSCLTFIPNRENRGDRFEYPGGSLFFPRSTLDKVGLFREDMRSGADYEWARRVFNAEIRTSYVDEAIVLYEAKSWVNLMRNGVRIGKGRRELCKSKDSPEFIKHFLRMRPPSPKYLNRIINDRGKPAYKKKFVQLIFSIWMYRIAREIGWFSNY